MNYPPLFNLTPNGTIYSNPVMGTLEALLPPGPYKTAHAPALLELNDGTLLCAWFAGSYEGSPDVGIVCARLEKDGAHWSEPVPISRDPERSEQNPSLFLTDDQQIWAIYTAQMGRASGKDNMQFTAVVRRQCSCDGGHIWGAYDVMFPQEGTFCRQPIQVLSSGRWIFGTWICSDSPSGLAEDFSAMRVSDDLGATWRRIDIPGSRGRVHPNVLELGFGHLVVFMRSREADFIYRSESVDNGDTWSVPVPTSLPNNNSSISALRLKSGRVAIAYNPTCTPDHQPGRASWPGLRCPVAVALSEDGGISFPLIRYLEMGEGYVGSENSTNNLQYEYPYLMQAGNGKLHLAYAYRNRKCIKWMTFSESDVAGEKRETVGLYNPTAAKFD